MRILFVSSQYPPHELGGYEQLCQEAGEVLMSRGHEVRILTSRYGLRPGEDLRCGNVDRSLHLMTDIHYYRPADFFLRFPSNERANLAALKSTLDQFKPDVIMFWGMFALSHALPFWAEKWSPGRVAYYLASYWPLDEDLHEAYWKSPANRRTGEWIKRPLRALALSRMRRQGYPPKPRLNNVVACSEYVRDRLVEAGRIAPDSRVIYAGSDPELYMDRRRREQASPGHILRLLYFGRLVPDKGVQTAIEAVGLLKREGLANHVELTILGDGHPDYTELLARRVDELGIGSQVCFVPKVARVQIPARLKEHDVFLFTSIWPEPFGRTIVEAMLAGLVVIGSDVGGSQEIFKYYERDLLFPPGNAQALAGRIKWLMHNSGEFARLSADGRALALGRFTTQRMTDGIETFLLDVASRPPAAEQR